MLLLLKKVLHILIIDLIDSLIKHFYFFTDGVRVFFVIQVSVNKPVESLLVVVSDQLVLRAIDHNVILLFLLVYFIEVMLEFVLVCEGFFCS